ncbi:hypothetical protein [Saccharibacillus alkalitolerans]|uniref:Uncharacterized protein n=1 Tax=Saccharibacillus alkalitolerans TaxID=2705290 RepID=A0ABX0F9X4_9BACL|nr:hypothetical protein [Saccharibacillus alkalitolerans]NGZ77113.1 hypothetical protein [Saccharibacillus alkalitolerans]
MLILAAASAAGFGFSVYFGFRGVWVAAYLTLALGIAFAALARMMYKWAFLFVRAYRDMQRPDWRPAKDLNGVAARQLSEIPIPGGRAKEALIAGEAWTQSRHKRIGYIYWTDTVLILQYEDEEGTDRYLKSLPFRTDREGFEDVLFQLRREGIPLYRTELNLIRMKAEDFREEYASLPKSLYDPGIPIERHRKVRREEFPLPWKSLSAEARERAAERRNDKRFYRPVRIGGFLVNFLIALLWIPLWEPIPGTNGFLWADDFDSASGALALFNLTWFAVAGRYWRGSLGRAGLKVPLDVLKLIAVHMIGLAGAGLYRSVEGDYYMNMLLLDLTLGVFLIGVFAFERLSTAQERRFVSPDSVDANGLEVRTSEKEEQPGSGRFDTLSSIVFLLLLAANFLMGWLLLPNAALDSENGVYDITTPFLLAAFLLLPVTGAYWRKSTKLWAPLNGAVFLFGVQFVGTLLGMPDYAEADEIRHILFYSAVLLAIGLYPVFIVMRTAGYLSRRSRERRKERKAPQ